MSFVQDEFDDKAKATIAEHEHSDKQAISTYDPAHAHYNHFRTVKVFWRVCLIASGLCMGAIFDVYASLVPNNIVAHPGFIAEFGTSLDAAGNIALNPNTLSNWNLVSLLGNVIGLGVGNAISDRFGRKWAFYSLNVVLIIAVALSLTVKDSAGWGARGVMAGLGAGLIQCSLIPYLSEIAPVKVRGAFLSGYSFFWNVGILVASVGIYVAGLTEPLNWRQSFWAQFVFLGLFCVALVIAPESPWWLIRKGKREQAIASMRRLYGNVASYDIAAEYKIIQDTIEAEQSMAQGATSSEWQLYRDCFRGTNLRRTLVTAVPIWCQAYSGVVLFYGYTTYFFQQAGFPRPFEANLIFSCISLLGIFVSFFTLEWFGRRPTMIAGTAVCAIACWALGGIAFQTTPNGSGMVAIACIWVFFFAVSISPMGYNYVGEVPTQRLRSKAATIVFGSYALTNLYLSYMVPYMLSPLEWGWGLKAGLFFGGAVTVMLVILIFTAVETKGRSSAEIDQMFMEKVGPFQSAKWKPQPVQRDSA